MQVEDQNVCEESTFDGLFMSIAPVLRNFLLYKFRQESTAEDAVQEAFSTLWQNCKNVTVALAKAYVFKVAQNQLLKKIDKDISQIFLLHTKSFSSFFFS